MSPAVIAPATRSPNYWRTPNQPGSSAQESQTEMARQYLGLLWEGLMVGLRLGLPRCPGPPRPSGEQPRRRRRLCSSIPMLQRAIWTAVNRTTSGFFYPIEEAELGPVAGKRVLHLQCHFGSDTLKFAQRGANAVGLDFSADAIAAARRLAGELGLADRAHFVLADLYNAPAAIAEPAGFDIVFVSCDLLAARHPPMGRDRRPFLEAGRLFVPRRGASDGDGIRRCGDIARRAPRLFRAVSGARGGGHGADPRLH